MKRMFWLGLGLAVGAELARRVSQLGRRLTPGGVAENVATGLRELAGGLGAFGADVRAGMAEREHELSAMVDQRTGIRVGTRTGRARGAGE